MIEAGELAAYLEAQAELAPFWLVTGSEDLLKLESVDLIRERARALGYTDAFLEKDAGIKHALPDLTPAERLAAAERWRPWRAYANLCLWNSLG